MQQQVVSEDETNKKSQKDENFIFLSAQTAMTPINENICFDVCRTQDDFDKLKRGLALLEQAKIHDQQRDYYTAIREYRDGVDYLMDEFMSRRCGNEQSKEYLRNKCHKIMNRVDILKKLIKQQEHEVMQQAINHDQQDAQQ